MENTELVHHGIKGQKWGVRRFQNADGSLTNAGKKHRSLGETIHNYKVKVKRKKALEKARAAKEEKKAAQEAEKKAAVEREEKRAKLLKSTDAGELYKNRDLLSTAEIEERLGRIGTEQKLANLAESTKKGGKYYMDKIISGGKTVNDLYKAATGKTIADEIKKALGFEDDTTFDLNKAYKNMDKMTDEQLKKVAGRVESRNKVKKAWDDEYGKNSNTPKHDDPKPKDPKPNESSNSKPKGNDKTTTKGGKQKSEDKSEKVEGDVEWYDYSKRSTYKEKADKVVNGKFRDVVISGVPATTTSSGQDYASGYMEYPIYYLEDRSR